jgi:N-acetylglutamate synthase-like GNAT family acetyltransferase
VEDAARIQESDDMDEPKDCSAALRGATLRDAERIHALIRLHPDELVPRPMGKIVENIDRFIVAECGGELAGCAAY